MKKYALLLVCALAIATSWLLEAGGANPRNRNRVGSRGRLSQSLTGRQSSSTAVVYLPYFADGVSVGNLPTSTNWQEISGVATPQNSANSTKLWIASDSPANMLAAVSTTDASNQGVWTLTSGPTISDLEDIASATVGGQPYLYLADIGDNPNSRSTFQLIRAKEPTITGSNGSIAAIDYETITCAYPGGGGAPSHKDAECLLVDPLTSATGTAGDMYVITKREAVPGVYQLAHAASYTGTQTLTDLGNMYDIPDVTTTPLGSTACNVVGGCIRADGKEILIKNYDQVFLFTRDPATQTVMQALQGTPTVVSGYVGGGSVSPAKSHPTAEPQGESVCYYYNSQGYWSASEYLAAAGSSSGYPLFAYARLTKTPTTVSFQDGVAPTAGYAGTTTTYIWGTNPSTDRSAEATYVVDTTPGNATDDRRGLLKFDLSTIPTTATVVGATLEQWIAAEGQGWKAYRMLVPWTGTSTHTSLGGVDNNGTKAAIAESWRNGVNLDTILSVTVRDNALVSDVQNMVSNPSTNYGWLLKGLDEATGDGVQFDSKAGATASRRPRLTIRYTQ